MVFAVKLNTKKQDRPENGRSCASLESFANKAKPTEELLETSLEYNEYLNLIDQSVEVKSDEPVNDETEAPLLHKRWIDKLIDFILYVIKNIIMIYIRIY